MILVPTTASRRLWLLLAVYAVLSMTDAAYTAFVFAEFEVNPVMGWMLQCGVVPFLLFKLFLTLGSCLLLYRAHDSRYSHGVESLAKGACVLYVTLVLLEVANTICH